MRLDFTSYDKLSQIHFSHFSYFTLFIISHRLSTCTHDKPKKTGFVIFLILFYHSVNDLATKSDDKMSCSSEVFIVSAARTPIGSFQGAFNNVPAHDLGAVVLQECVKRANLSSSDVDEVILGQALQAGQGQNPARQASLKGKLMNHVKT
jgi:hypothetical protein